MLLIVMGGSVVSLVVTALLIRSWLRTVPPGQALVINGAQGEPRVSFTGALVFPVLNRAETIDLTVHQIVIVRRGKEGVIDTLSSSADLPPGVPRHLLAAVGRGALSRDAGRATFRWTQLDVSADQLVAGARLVRALRDDPRAYR